MTDAVGLIIDAAKAIFDFRNKIKENDKTRKENIAVYYEDIAQTLNETAKELRAGNIPHGSCGKMKALAEQLPQTIGDYIGEEEADKLARQLIEAHEIEWLISDLGQGDEKERERRLGTIEKAAGLFDASASSIRASR